MTPDEVRDLILSLPLVEARTTHGLPSYKAAGKFLTRLRAEDDSLVVYTDGFEHRDLLLEVEPATFHITDHYRNYPIVLARIGSVDPAWLKARLIVRWKAAVPKRMQKGLNQ